MKLNKVEAKEQYQVQIRNRFTALESLYDDTDINRGLGNCFREYQISTKESLGYYELKEHKPWFSGGYSKV
jgi:hypothetical protein